MICENSFFDEVLFLEDLDSLERKLKEKTKKTEMPLLIRCHNDHFLPFLASWLGKIDVREGASLDTVHSLLEEAGFRVKETYALILTDDVPFALFPLKEKRMFRFFMRAMLRGQCRRMEILRWMAPLLSPVFLAANLFVLAERA